MHYRRIWEISHGNIPDGFEIHHIDGNRSNNDLSNLKLVSIEEHLEIHRSQGDIGAVHAIMIRMDEYDRDEIARLASITQKKLISEGSHNFQKIDRKQISKKTMQDRLLSGRPAFLGIADTKANSTKAGMIAKEKNAGYLDVNSDNHGSKHVKDTCWWTHSSGTRKRSKDNPGNDWSRGMKYNG
jgi:hypothetical protein